ncbi:DNA-binding transcriptional ArsR family regulator [Thermocatellispora tengchongensis]|uniref:DNA-binding transcriptional ArsR family regulator n=1 Tax=Thermocatellispora tengchongensis TaxID=1073253 RepID=A0A840PN95_9ACTN|nr:hypothetical protein [Thermocatellispora tengchongensis]MBB5140356.1 DNA-binding transcriptional ArsR family regulator [Thermocatellispora tengchongensis]
MTAAGRQHACQVAATTPRVRRDEVPGHLVGPLQQLLDGAPDTIACRRLSMSQRTFSRRVAELLDHLGATTRFQGGVEAVRRGWVEIGPGLEPGLQPGLEPERRTAD